MSMNTVEPPKHRVTQAARINPDSRAALHVVVVGTIILALVSFIDSFAGLMAVAQWAAIPRYLWWALPVFIDGAIIVYSMSVLVYRQRGESSVFAWVALLGFTGVSVFANGAHAYAEGDPTQWQTWIGTFLAGLAPAAVALAIHNGAMLLVEAPTPVPPPGIKHETPETVAVGDVIEPLAHAAVKNEVETVPANLPEQVMPQYVSVVPLPEVVAPESNIAVSSAHSSEEGEGIMVDAAPLDLSSSEQSTKSSSMTVPATWPERESPKGKDERAEALKLSEQGLSQREIGEKFGVSKSTISRWIREAKAEAAENNTHLRVVGD